MTKKEEKALLLASFFMLIAAGLTVAIGLYLVNPVSENVSETLSANDSREEAVLSEEPKKEEEPYQELYYLSDEGFAAGTVTDANEKHAECFVILQCEVETASADEGMDEQTDRYMVLFYNDEFIIPEYDSRMFALDLCEYFTRELGDTSVSAAFSEEEALQDAMVPAVRIVTNIAASDMKPVLTNGMTMIFTETDR